MITRAAKVAILGAIGALWFPIAVRAADLVATKPGLMCVSADALAKLTLPDGSSKTTRANPSPEDLAIKRDGQCIDIKLGTHVSVSAVRSNTSVVSVIADGGKPKTYIVPNIDFQPAASRSKPASEVKQVITAPGGATNYYIMAVPASNGAGDEATVIEAKFNSNATSVVLLNSKPDGDPQKNLTDFSNLFLSPDGKTLYFQTDAWATSNAVHKINLATKQNAFVASGEIACVVLSGEHQGDLVIDQHRYFVQGGSYDALWLFSPDGKELGLVSLNTNARRVCPTLGN